MSIAPRASPGGGRHPIRLKHVVLGLCWVLLAAVTMRAGTWYEEYDMALKAIQEKNYAQAEAKLKAAVSQRAEPGRNLRMYGTKYKPLYVPDFYLGVVYLNQGKYQEAKLQFDRVTASGVLQKGDPEYGQLADMVRSLAERSRTAGGEEAASIAARGQERLLQGDIEGAKRLLEEARQKDESNPTVAALAAGIASVEAEMRSKAESEARARLEEERRRADLETRQTEFRTLMTQAESALRRKDFASARARAEEALARGVDEERVRQMLGSIALAEKIEALRAAVGGQRWPEAQALAQEVARLDPGNSELKSLQEAIEKGLVALGQDQLLEEGIRAFYSGNYQQSITLLQRIPAEAGSLARSTFYVGCSYAALAFRNKDGRDDLLSKARDSFGRSKKASPSMQHDERFISPRILQLYQQSR